ncbi:MAG: hypothetical protein EBZ67_17035, partial [Chitinophagia bacterium]|nr:hypothetical protein [Chitinophagia bacterium]
MVPNHWNQKSHALVGLLRWTAHLPRHTAGMPRRERQGYGIPRDSGGWVLYKDARRALRLSHLEFNSVMLACAVSSKRRLVANAYVNDDTGEFTYLHALRPTQGYGNCDWIQPLRTYANIDPQLYSRLSCLVHGTRMECVLSIAEYGLCPGSALPAISPTVRGSAGSSGAFAVQEAVGGGSAGSPSAFAAPDTPVDSFTAAVGNLKRSNRNDLHMACFAPWSSQVLAGMHFAADTHVWVRMDALDETVQLYASWTMVILTRDIIAPHQIEAMTRLVLGIYRVIFHYSYAERTVTGHVGGSALFGGAGSPGAAIEPSSHLLRGRWFRCPCCQWPLRGGFLECPRCEA